MSFEIPKSDKSVEAENNLAALAYEDEKQKKLLEDPEEIKYDSETTRNYFKDWEGLVLNGNIGMKEKIRKNILQVEQERADDYRYFANEQKITIEELKKDLQKRVEKMVESSGFFRATNMSVISSIMINDGRWKSQFETGRSDGYLNPQRRSSVENKMFDFPDDKDAENTNKRPIYGYFSDSDNGIINEHGNNPPPNAIKYCGTVNFKFKKNKIIERTTITFQDSLNHPNWMPSPASKPHFTSLMVTSGQTINIHNISSTSKCDWNSYANHYTEVQYHDGLTMEDVESIHISTKNGMSEEDMQKVRDLHKKYMELHPESEIKLIEY